MFYSTDENGNIIQSDSIDILPEVYQDIFINTVSGSDLVGGDPDERQQILDNSDSSFNDLGDYSYFESLDNIYSLLANIPSYTVFPNTSAVSVFRDVLNGLDHNIGYILLSGSDTSTTYLYYSPNFSLSGSQVTLSDPVKLCTYMQYRPNNNTSYTYTYTVQNVSESTFNISNQLIYTNIIDGYPDLIEYKSHESFSLLFICALSALICSISCFTGRFRSRKRGKDNG